MPNRRFSYPFALVLFVILSTAMVGAPLLLNARANYLSSVSEFLGIAADRPADHEKRDNNLAPQSDQFFAGDGSALNATKWGTSAAGPFTSAFTAGNVANFATPSGTGTGASITVGGINAAENFTLTSIGGTISNQGNVVVPITVATSKTLDFSTQAFTTSATAGYNFTGPGVLALGGGTYQGGFTINSGTLIARGVNAMGGGAANTLTINGGTIAANATRDFSGKYGGGITIGGNFQLGALTANTPLSASAADLTFSNNISLGASSRTITIGGDGNYTMGGVISGAAGSGVTIARVAGTGGAVNFTGINTYTGNTLISNGDLSLLANGSIANSPVVEIGPGGIFDVTALTTALTLSSGQTLRASGTSGTGSINTSSTKGLTTASNSPIQFTAFNGLTAPLTVALSGVLTLQPTNPVTVTVANGGTPLTVGNYKLIAKSGTASVSGTPTSVTVNGDGIAAGTIASLVNTAGELFLHVATDTTAATDFFRSNVFLGSGDWTAPGSWQSSHDGVNNWITATSAPTTAANTVTITANNLIVITTPVSFDQTVVQANGTLFVDPTGTATIAGSPGLTVDSGGFFQVRGAVINNGSVSVSGSVLAQFANVSFSGNSFSYSGANSELQYDTTGSRTTTTTELPSSNGPRVLDDSSGAGSTLTLGGAFTVPTELILGNGTFATGANLTFSNGCFIIRSDGAMTGTPTFAGTVSVEYVSAATAGPELPTSTTALNNVQLGGPIDVTLPTNYTVNGILALASGRVIPGANILSIAGTGSVTRSAGTSGYVIGNLQRTFTAAGSTTFDVGTANGYSPVTVNATAGTFPANFKISATQTAHPNVTDPTKALSRYWTLTGTGITADLTFNYLDPVDIPGTATEGNFVITKCESGVCTTPGGSVNTTANTATIAGVSSFSDWTLAEPTASMPGTLQFSSPLYLAAENVAGGNLVMSVTRTGGTDGAVGATVTFTNVTATGGGACGAGVDFINTAIPVSFASGSSTAQTVNVPICDDSIYEGNETFTATVGSFTGGATGGAQTSATGSITENDPQPSISINDVTQAEGNSGTSLFRFNVSLSAVSGLPVTVHYQTADGTATAGSDYVAIPDTILTIPAGSINAPQSVLGNLPVTVNGDTTPEADETFFVNLSTPTNATISDSQGVATILNDDTTLQFSAATYSGAEGTSVTVTVTRNTSIGTSTVQYATSNGTAMGGTCATGGIDYASASGTLTFNNGDTSKTFQVTLCNDLLSENPAETINLTLSTPTGGSIGGIGAATIAIDDVASEFSSAGSLIPSPGGTVASPIVVSGYQGNVLGMRVTLNGLNTVTADNIDVLLVDPSGTRKYVLMGDTGGLGSLFGGVLTFEDAASAHLPDSTAISNGQNYKPTVCATPVSNFGAGAPAGPYQEPGCTTDGVLLSPTFSGFNPNGTWMLYLRDDNGAAGLGALTSLNNWSLQFLLPTAAPVSLSGRVLTSGGQGIRNTKVTISGGNLSEPRTVYTGNFGYFDFEGLTPGETYIVTVEPKRYVLSQPARVVTLLDNIADLDFIAEPLE